MSAFEVNFYYKQMADCPVRDFLDIVGRQNAGKAFRCYLPVGNQWHTAAGALFQIIGDGIFELRAKQSSNITRILYFFVVGHQIILTNGFVKKTQKTPPEEIALAQKYRADYFDRKESSS